MHQGNRQRTRVVFLNPHRPHEERRSFCSEAPPQESFKVSSPFQQPFAFHLHRWSVHRSSAFTARLVGENLCNVWLDQRCVFYLRKRTDWLKNAHASAFRCLIVEVGSTAAVAFSLFWTSSRNEVMTNAGVNEASEGCFRVRAPRR